MLGRISIGVGRRVERYGVATTVLRVSENLQPAAGGLVYVLTNAAMPGLVKIGVTTGIDPENRASQLYTTGVPVPFDVEFAGEVADPLRVERALHNAFRDRRVNPRREFFRIEPDQPIGMLRAFDVVDVTAVVETEIESGVSDSERTSREQLRTRRPQLNFIEMGIPVGSELVFVEDDAIRVRVVEARKVEHEGVVHSLSPLTRDIKQLDYYVQPGAYWVFEGRLLGEIYNETYPRSPD